MAVFTGTSGADVANAPSGVLTGFTGGTLAELQDATGDCITGAEGADTVVAGSGNDTIRGGLGTDSIDGGDGDDRIQITGSEFTGAETIAGGGGAGDILEASGTINFDNGLATLSGIETLVVSGTNPHLTFSAAQFQNFTSMTETATPGTVDVFINVSTSFSMAPLIITGWNNQHRVWLLGSAAANTITTNDVSYNRVAGYGGADTLIGGANTDLFYYYAAGDVEVGEVIDGGGGTRNDLQLAGPAGTIYDFTVATITNIQTIDFSLGGGGTATMPASLFTGFAGGIAQIFGSYGADTIITTGSQVNMGAAQFYFDPPGFIGNWDTSMDRIFINGTTGIDTLIGSDTNDSISGLEGDDRINPSGGADSVDGGDGFDIISYGVLGFAGLTINLNTGVHTGEAANDTLVGFEGVSGTSNADDLTGNNFENRLEGQNGNDTLTGLDGADTLVGGYGDDSMQGGDGFDVFEATHELDGADIMRGGLGFDIVSYAAITSGNDITVTLNGNTLVTVGIGGGNSDSIVGVEGVVGAAGEDSLTGDGLANFFRGLGASDTLIGLGGDDTIEGSADTDYIYGGAGADSIAGNEFSNSDGDASADVLIGEAGDDTMTGSAGNDYLYGGADDDSLTGNSGTDVLIGEGGNDRLLGGENDDYHYGGAGINVMFGGNGLDAFISEGASDIMDGGAGRGYFYRYAAGVSLTTGGSDIDIFVGGAFASNDTVYGFDGADYIYGGDGDDLLIGDAGNDVLLGQNGNDTLDGGSGTNTIWANDAGNDQVVVRIADAGNHSIEFFEAGGTNDTLRIIGSSMTSFSDYQNLLANLGTAINGNLLYDTGGGLLLYLNLGASQSAIQIQGVSAYAVTAGDFVFG
jgi:Ca2+-binding RTX toxin-like protein